MFPDRSTSELPGPDVSPLHTDILELQAIMEKYQPSRQELLVGSSSTKSRKLLKPYVQICMCPACFHAFIQTQILPSNNVARPAITAQEIPSMVRPLPCPLKKTLPSANDSSPASNLRSSSVTTRTGRKAT
jgi:hypothetical protein